MVDISIRMEISSLVPIIYNYIIQILCSVYIFQLSLYAILDM